MLSFLAILALFSLFSLMGRAVESWGFGRTNFVGVEPFMVNKLTGLQVQNYAPIRWILDHTVLAWGFSFLIVLALQRMGASDLIVATVIAAVVGLGSCYVIGRNVFNLDQDPSTKTRRTDPLAIDYCDRYESWTTVALYFIGAWVMSVIVRKLDA